MIVKETHCEGDYAYEPLTRFDRLVTFINISHSYARASSARLWVFFARTGVGFGRAAYPSTPEIERRPANYAERQETSPSSHDRVQLRTISPAYERWRATSVRRRLLMRP
jgi:hypothetical protein